MQQVLPDSAQSLFHSPIYPTDVDCLQTNLQRAGAVAAVLHLL